MSSTSPLKIVFAGTPEFSAVILKSILSLGHNVSAVYCQPDRRVGRGKKITFGPVKKLANQHEIPVEQPEKFSQGADENNLTPFDKLASYQPDLMIVVAYGLILPESILSLPKFGCVNIHASLLPRWRGAAPIQRAIEAGDHQTGITIMQMDKGLDTGDILSTHPCEIHIDETGSSLHDRLAIVGSQAIDDFLEGFSPQTGSSLNSRKQQDGQLVTYAHKLSKKEAEIDWSESAVAIERKIRAFNSWPVSFTRVGDNRLRVWRASLSDNNEGSRRNLKVGDKVINPVGGILGLGKDGIQVQCGDGQSLFLTQLQVDGSRAMSAPELLNSKSQWFIDNPVLGN